MSKEWGWESHRGGAELWSVLKSLHDQGLAATGLKPNSFQQLTAFRSSPELGLFSKMFVNVSVRGGGVESVPQKAAISFSKLNSKWGPESSSLNTGYLSPFKWHSSFILHLFSWMQGKSKLQLESRLDWYKCWPLKVVAADSCLLLCQL